MISQSESSHIKTIRQLLASCEYDLALERSLNATEQFPSSAEICEAVADIYLGKGEIEQALKYYEISIRLGLTATSAYINAGLCSELIGNYVEAVEYLTTAVKGDSQNFIIFLARARAFRNLDRLEETKADEIRALSESFFAHLFTTNDLSWYEIKPDNRLRCEIHKMVMHAETSIREFVTYSNDHHYAFALTHAVRKKFFPNTKAHISHEASEAQGLEVFLACEECLKLEEIWMQAKILEYERIRLVEEDRNL